jgi:hypothetical protein
MDRYRVIHVETRRQVGPTHTSNDAAESEARFQREKRGQGVYEVEYSDDGKLWMPTGYRIPGSA